MYRTGNERGGRVTDEPDEEQGVDARRPVAAVLVTFAALFGLWALVWYNVPRDISRPMVISPPPALAPQPSLSDLQAAPTDAGTTDPAVPHRSPPPSNR